MNVILSMSKKEPHKKSYFHRGVDRPLLGLTIPEHFLQIAEKFPDNEALISIPQRKRITYSGLLKEAKAVAKGLMAHGFSKGDRLGIWATNNMEWVIVQVATAMIGAVLVNINPAYRPRELDYALKRSEVQGLFVIPSFKSSDYVAMLLELIPELKEANKGQVQDPALQTTEYPYLKKIFLYNPKDPLKTERPWPGFFTWSEVIEKADEISDEQLDEALASLDMDEPINIQYTSGTTGFPKAVVLSHHNILNNAYFTGIAMGFTQKDRLCVSVPFYHCFGMVLANLLCLSHGASIVIPGEHFKAGEALKAVESERCTAIHGVPTMFIAELEHPEFSRFNLTSLRTGIMAGAPCPPELVKKVIKEMHCKEILIGYGETEASPLTHLTERDDTFERRVETVGKNLPHQEVKVVDVASGKTLPVGEIGEICFRGYHIMKGYYKDPEATKKAIDEKGWLHSGDLGSMDGDGYVRITGRLKEMIIRGGENIYPAEIEKFLFIHPKVTDVAVFGIPDEYWGEEIMAWIRLKEGESAIEEEIREFCKGKIAHFKIPRYIWFVEEFPMTVTGKLQKFRMREIALEKMKKDQI